MAIKCSGLTKASLKRLLNKYKQLTSYKFEEVEKFVQDLSKALEGAKEEDILETYEVLGALNIMMTRDKALTPEAIIGDRHQMARLYKIILEERDKAKATSHAKIDKATMLVSANMTREGAEREDNQDTLYVFTENLQAYNLTHPDNIIDVAGVFSNDSLTRDEIERFLIPNGSSAVVRMKRDGTKMPNSIGFIVKKNAFRHLTDTQKEELKAKGLSYANFTNEDADQFTEADEEVFVNINTAIARQIKEEIEKKGYKKVIFPPTFATDHARLPHRLAERLQEILRDELGVETAIIRNTQHPGYAGLSVVKSKGQASRTKNEDTIKAEKEEKLQKVTEIVEKESPVLANETLVDSSLSLSEFVRAFPDDNERMMLSEFVSSSIREDIEHTYQTTLEFLNGLDDEGLNEVSVLVNQDGRVNPITNREFRKLITQGTDNENRMAFMQYFSFIARPYQRDGSKGEEMAMSIFSVVCQNLLSTFMAVTQLNGNEDLLVDILMDAFHENEEDDFSAAFMSLDKYKDVQLYDDDGNKVTSGNFYDTFPGLKSIASDFYTYTQDLSITDPTKIIEAARVRARDLLYYFPLLNRYNGARGEAIWSALMEDVKLSLYTIDNIQLAEITGSPVTSEEKDDIDVDLDDGVVDANNDFALYKARFGDPAHTATFNIKKLFSEIAVQRWDKNLQQFVPVYTPLGRKKCLPFGVAYYTMLECMNGMSSEYELDEFVEAAVEKHPAFAGFKDRIIYNPMAPNLYNPDLRHEFYRSMQRPFQHYIATTKMQAYLDLNRKTDAVSFLDMVSANYYGKRPIGKNTIYALSGVADQKALNRLRKLCGIDITTGNQMTKLDAVHNPIARAVTLFEQLKKKEGNAEFIPRILQVIRILRGEEEGVENGMLKEELQNIGVSTDSINFDTLIPHIDMDTLVLDADKRLHNPDNTAKLADNERATEENVNALDLLNVYNEERIDRILAVLNGIIGVSKYYNAKTQIDKVPNLVEDCRSQYVAISGGLMRSSDGYSNTSVLTPDGKTRFNYGVPDFITKFVQSVSGNKERALKYLSEEFGKFTFYERCDMIQQLMANDSLRENMEVFNVLSVGGTKENNSIQKASDTEFEHGILALFFSERELSQRELENGKIQYAKYRFPLISDVDALVELRYMRDAAAGYEERIEKKLGEMMWQEAIRIRDVLMSAKDKDNVTIEFFNDKRANGTKLNFFPELERGLNGRLVDKYGNRVNKRVILDTIDRINRNSDWGDIEKEEAIVSYFTDLARKLMRGDESTGLKGRVDRFIDKYTDNDCLRFDSEWSYAKDAAEKKASWESSAANERIEDEAIIDDSFDDEDSPAIDTAQKISKDEAARLERQRKIDAVREKLRNFYYNDFFVQGQFIEVFGGDLAYYKNFRDFVKRCKQAYACGDRLYGVEDEDIVITNEDGTVELQGKRPSKPIMQHAIYLEDLNVMATSYADIADILATDETMTQFEKDMLSGALHQMKNICSTDGQSFRTLDSLKEIFVAMGGVWTPRMEEAKMHLETGRGIIADDLLQLWQQMKPFVFSHEVRTIGGRTEKVNFQHKNSEYLLSAMYTAFNMALNRSPELLALHQFMMDNNIAVAHFHSVVKEGYNGGVDINYNYDAFRERVRKDTLASKSSENVVVITDKNGNRVKIPAKSFNKFLEDSSNGTGLNVLLDNGMISQAQYNKIIESFRHKIPSLQNDSEADEGKLAMARLVSTRLSDLNLSVRAMTSLKDAHIRTVGDLVSMSRKELKRQKGVTDVILKEITDIVSSLGLDFSMDVSGYKKIARSKRNQAYRVTAKEVRESSAYKALQRQMGKSDSPSTLGTTDGNAYKTNIDPNMIHQVRMSDYMIVTPTANHMVDHVALFGSQLRNIMPSDLPKTFRATIKVNGATFELDAEQTVLYYNTLIVDQLMTSFEAINSKFANIKVLQAELLHLVDGNEKYGQDVHDALQLNEAGTGFCIPPNSPNLTNKLEELFLSLFKNNIQKQKIDGGNTILVSNYGLSDALHIKYREVDAIDDEGNPVYEEVNGKTVRKKVKAIEYIEALLPYTMMSQLEDFLIDAPDGSGSKMIDFKKMEDTLGKTQSEEILKVIGYRIPTEDKYSIFPIRIVGFMPPTMGGSIMLPAEIIAMSGTDFDIDKLFLMLKAVRKEDFAPNIRREFKHYIADMLGDERGKFLEALEAISKGVEEEAFEAYDNFDESEGPRELTDDENAAIDLLPVISDKWFKHLDAVRVLYKTQSGVIDKELEEYFDRLHNILGQIKQAAALNLLRNSKRGFTKEEIGRMINPESNEYCPLFAEFLNQMRQTPSSNGNENAFEDFKSPRYMVIKPALREDPETGKPNLIDISLKAGRIARNNMLIDVVWAILTSPECAKLMMQPGNFNTIKDTSRRNIILKDEQALRNFVNLHREEIQKHGINTVFNHTKDRSNSGIVGADNMSQREYLEAFNEEYAEVQSPMDFGTYLTTHRNLMDGNALIGGFAVNSSNHYKYQFVRATIDGSVQFYVGDSTQSVLAKEDLDNVMPKVTTLDEPISVVNGIAIGRLCSEYQAASPDNGKDPCLGDLNANMTTLPRIGFLSRCGIGIQDVGFLNILKTKKGQSTDFYDMLRVLHRAAKSSDYADYFKKVKATSKQSRSLDGFILDIPRLMNAYVRFQLRADLYMDPENGITQYLSDLTNGFTTDETMAGELQYLMDFYLWYEDMDETARVLNMANNESRCDSVNGALPTDTASALQQRLKAQDFEKTVKRPDSPIHGLEAMIDTSMDASGMNHAQLVALRNVILGTPVPRMQAFYTFGIRSAHNLLKPYLPQLHDNVFNALEDLRDETGYVFTYKSDIPILKKYLAEMWMFMHTYINDALVSRSPFASMEDKEGQSLLDKRNYYINEFPTKLAYIMDAVDSKGQWKYPHLREKPILNMLVNFGRGITFSHVGKVFPLARKQYREQLLSLLAGAGIKDAEEKKVAINLAYDLWMYDFYATGFNFRHNNFGIFFGTDYFKNIAGGRYVKNLDDINALIITTDPQLQPMVHSLLAEYNRQFIRNHPQIAKIVRFGAQISHPLMKVKTKKGKMVDAPDTSIIRVTKDADGHFPKELHKGAVFYGVSVKKTGEFANNVTEFFKYIRTFDNALYVLVGDTSVINRKHSSYLEYKRVDSLPMGTVYYDANKNSDGDVDGLDDALEWSKVKGQGEIDRRALKAYNNSQMDDSAEKAVEAAEEESPESAAEQIEEVDPEKSIEVQEESPTIEDIQANQAAEQANDPALYDEQEGMMQGSDFEISESPDEGAESEEARNAIAQAAETIYFGDEDAEFEVYEEEDDDLNDLPDNPEVDPC